MAIEGISNSATNRIAVPVATFFVGSMVFYSIGGLLKGSSFGQRLFSKIEQGNAAFLAAGVITGMALIQRKDPQAEASGKIEWFEPKEIKESFENVIVPQSVSESLKGIVEFHKDSSKFQAMGVVPQKGTLLMGPPGTGKTSLAKAMAKELKLPLAIIATDAFASMYVGEGERLVRARFEELRVRQKDRPYVLFIDEVDSVATKRKGGSGAEDEHSRILNVVMQEIDKLPETTIVIAATNRAGDIDAAFARSCRFDSKVMVPRPDKEARKKILELQPARKARGLDLDWLAERTEGLSGADLKNKMNQAAILAVRKKKDAVDQECCIQAFNISNT